MKCDPQRCDLLAIKKHRIGKTSNHNDNYVIKLC